LRTKLKLDLVALGDMDLFAKNNVDGSNHPDWVPLSRLRDTLFLAVNTTAPYPVGMWVWGDEITPLWESFDAFVGRVIDKTAQVAFETAAWFGNQQAQFDCLDMMSRDERDFPAAIEYGLDMRNGNLDADAKVRLAAVLATAYLEIGDVANAEVELLDVVREFE